MTSDYLLNIGNRHKKYLRRFFAAIGLEAWVKICKIFISFFFYYFHFSSVWYIKPSSANVIPIFQPFFMFNSG